MQRYDRRIAVYEWWRKKIKLFLKGGQWDSWDSSKSYFFTFREGRVEDEISLLSNFLVEIESGAHLGGERRFWGIFLYLHL